MALFRNGEACIFSLSPKLKRNQKPYSFLLSKNQGKIFTVSVPVFALIALINFLGLTFYSLSEILTEKAPNELILVVSVSVALFTFFSYYFLFLWIRTSASICRESQTLENFRVDRWISLSLYSGSLSALLTPLFALARMKELSIFHADEDIPIKILKLALILMVSLMVYYCGYMIKSIWSEDKV
ncbi:MAG: hypothetical protein ABF533_09605 [Acetobacter persici]|uniref:hypothetical protein n=1 Tax=Acetobacter persici TaxID=1076596 RepID=UPI0039E8A9DD